VFFLMVVGEEIFLIAYIVLLRVFCLSCKSITFVLSALIEMMDEHHKG